MSKGKGSVIKTEIDREMMHEIAGFKGAIETKLGSTLKNLQPVAYTSQVVTGTIFQIKYESDHGTVHAKVFKPLPESGEQP